MKASEIKFQFYKNVVASHKSTASLTLEEIKNLSSQPSVLSSVKNFRTTKDQKYKKRIPCFTPMGYCKQGYTQRNLDGYDPSEFTMIDLDHVQDLEAMKAKFTDKERMQELGVVMVYVTVSGEGIRIIFRDFEGLSKMASALCLLKVMDLPTDRWDAQCRDITRCSIISGIDDFIYMAEGDEEINAYKPTEELLSQCDFDDDNISAIVKNDKSLAKNSARRDYNNATDYDGNKYSLYTEKQIKENDETYKDFEYKGRRVAEIARNFLSYKTQGQGPEDGQKHALYNQLCGSFRSIVDNNPRILHAVLPGLNNSLRETWDQCVYYCVKGKNNAFIDRPFYLWLREHGYTEPPATESLIEKEPDEAIQYRQFIKDCPPLPPIIAEYYKIAPLWFKLPVLFAAEGMLALYATNYRSKYFDGLPLSPTFYTLIYGPAACGKSFMTRLDPLLEPFILRDNLSNLKMRWYNELCQRTKNSDLPEKPKVKTTLIPARSSAGEICQAQENMGPHHWLQIISEFSVWSTNVMKASTDLSGMYRIGYENGRYGQQFMSANSYRGTVNLFPVILATCTEGQIDNFFKNTEDGLVTRFDYIPILNQEFADWEDWKLLTLKDQQRIEKVQQRLLATVFKDPTPPVQADVEKEDLKTRSNWDYDYIEPQEYDLSWLYAPLRQWLTDKLNEAKEDGNEVAAQLRKRSARKAFAYALLCYALWGKDDAKTRENIQRNMLWMADISYYFIRDKWEDVMQEKNKSAQHTTKRKESLLQSLPDKFNLAELDSAIRKFGRKTAAVQMARVWKCSGYIEEVGINEFKKTN